MPQINAWQRIRSDAQFDPLGEGVRPSAARDKIDFRDAGIAANRHALAAAACYAIGGDEVSGRRAVSTMDRWARHAIRHHAKHSYRPVAETPPGQGLFIADAVIRLGATYCLVHPLTVPDERTRFEDFIAILASLLRTNIRRWEAQNYYGGQRFNNHTSAHAVGLAAAGVILSDRSMMHDGLFGSHGNPQNLRDNIVGAFLTGPDDELCPYDRAPAPDFGEIYDRCQRRIGLMKAMLQLRYLVLGAEISYHQPNVDNLYEYVGPSRETIVAALDYYAPFFVHRDVGLKTGYYSREMTLPLRPALEVYDIVSRRHPSPSIVSVLAANARARAAPNYVKTHFGALSLLTHGLSLEEVRAEHEGQVASKA